MATASSYRSSPTAESSTDPWEWSDDEEELPVTWQTACAWQLPFGQHRGEALGVLVRTPKERNYLRWLLGWDKLREDTEAKIRCVLEHYEQQKPAKRKKTKKN